jgi:flagellar biosynthesis GTPase FlhF
VISVSAGSFVSVFVSGVEADVLNSAYVAKRISLLRARVEDVKADAEAKVNVVAAEINEFKNELNELDRDLFKARKADFADLYAKMGDALHERKDHERAADMFARGRDIDNRANARKWEQAIAKTLMDAAEACVKKNPDLKKSEKCNKLAERSKTAADRAKEQLASAAEKDEGAAEEMEDFMTSYNEMYGAGPKYYQMGFGWMHPYAPGKIEQLRVQGYQNYMMEQQQKMMQKMYGSHYGMGMNGMMSGMGMPGGGALY